MSSSFYEKNASPSMLNQHPLYYKAPVQVVTIFLFSGGEITGGDAVAGDRSRLFEIRRQFYA